MVELNSSVSWMVESGVGVHVSRLFLFFVLAFLVYFLFVGLCMLIATNKSAKRGRVIGIFVVGSLLFLGLLVYGYYNLDKVLMLFNV